MNKRTINLINKLAYFYARDENKCLFDDLGIERECVMTGKCINCCKCIFTYCSEGPKPEIKEI